MRMKYLYYMEDIVWTLLYLSSAGLGESMIIFLCPGERYSLVCSTNYTFLEWSVRITSQPMLQLYERTVPSSDRSPLILPIRVNTVNITFSRDSPRMVLPLVSTMTIENMNSYLEGTMINCTGVNSSSVSSVVLMTTIRVFDNDRDAPNIPEVVIMTDMTKFGNDNVTVTLEWPQFSGETYTVTAIPEPVNMSFIMSTRVQLVMLYNTQHNVMVAATLCGHRNATTNLMIYYGLDPVTPTVDCRAPQFTCDNYSNINYSSTLEGSTLQFSCVEGYLPSDVFTATCHPNGSWVPDPTRHTCTSASTVASETPSMEQNQNTASTFITAIVISTVIVYISSSILIFIVGCACGWCGHKHKAKGNTHSQAAPGPVYEDLQPSTSMQGDPQEKATFELKENVAYGPIQSTQQ